MWSYKEPAGRFFSDAEKAQLVVLFETILPGDETTPGARDADAAEYLSRLLAMPASTYYEIEGWKTIYKAGLSALDAVATAQFGKPLVGLTPAQATALMAALQAGTLQGFAPPTPVDQKAFFAAMRNHCIEGCFADPRWGGNKDNVMWRWYGYLQPAQNFRRPRG